MNYNVEDANDTKLTKDKKLKNGGLKLVWVQPTLSRLDVSETLGRGNIHSEEGGTRTDKGGPS